MLTPIEETYARATMLSHLCATLMSNSLAKQTSEDAIDFKVAWLGRFKKSIKDAPAWATTPATDQRDAEFRDRMISMASDFIELVTQLENDIRKQIQAQP